MIKQEFFIITELIFLVNKTLYEECEMDIQCADLSGQSVCKEIRGRKLCLCNTGYLEDKNTLTCQKGILLFNHALQIYTFIQYIFIKSLFTFISKQ